MLNIQSNNSIKSEEISVTHSGGGCAINSNEKMPCDDTWIDNNNNKFTIKCTREVHSKTLGITTYSELKEFVRFWGYYCEVLEDSIKK